MLSFRKWFPFGGVTVISLFGAIFGLSLLVFLFTGFSNVDMFYILSSTSALPNPVGFVRGCGELFSLFKDIAERLKFQIPSIPRIPSTGSGLLDAIFGVFNAIITVINILTGTMNLIVPLLPFILCMIVVIPVYIIGTVINLLQLPILWIRGDTNTGMIINVDLILNNLIGFLRKIVIA